MHADRTRVPACEDVYMLKLLVFVVLTLERIQLLFQILLISVLLVLHKFLQRKRGESDVKVFFVVLTLSFCVSTALSKQTNSEDVFADREPYAQICR